MVEHGFEGACNPANLKMILHLDMDAFYASVEQLDQPWLKGRCVIVGGTGRRGVVSAASYEARAFGVRSAMPVFQARQLCPSAVFVPPRMPRYQEISRQIMALLQAFSPRVEPVSIDEAFMDLGGTERLHGAVQDIARRIKQCIRETVHLTCSIGVAPNRFLAKVASDFQKPDGLTLIGPDHVTDFIRRLPIGKVPGVGPKAQAKAAALGICFLGDIGKFPETILVSHFGAYGRRLFELAGGKDSSAVEPHTLSKSISSECTFPEDTLDPSALSRCLLAQAEEVAAGLRKEGVRARTVVLKIKHADFELHTRRITFGPPTQSSKELYRQALRLLEDYRLDQKIRLIGLGAAGFVPAGAPRQMELFAEKRPTGSGWEKVDRTVEAIKGKFGENVIQRATLKEE
jgi:DNA polymerase-4